MLLRKLLAEHVHAYAKDDFLKSAYVLISITLVLMAGLMSGLTLGLLSLDMVDLEVVKRSGTPSEKRYAEKITPVLKHQHMLLVTLLLCNAICNEALPLFLDRLSSPTVAIIISVTVVLLFGEIIPQSICSRYGLQVGAYSAGFVQTLMWVCFPLAYPIGKLLDAVLGKGHTALFRRAQLKALVDIHGETAGLGGTLSLDEVNVIRGALDLTHKTAIKSMTPLDKVFMLSDEDTLDVETMQAVLLSGHSRIPVYRGTSRADIIGLILVKELLLVDPSDDIKVRDVRMRVLPHVVADTPMYDMLRLFETGRCHMAVLTRPYPAPTNSTATPLVTTTPNSGNVTPRMHEGRVQTTANGPGARYQRLAAVDAPCSETELPACTGRMHPSTAGHDRSPRAVPPSQQQQQEACAVWASFEMNTVSNTSFTLAAAVPSEPVGIITIEDVFEELLQQEIVDETDQYIDNMQTSRVNAALLARSLPPRLRELVASGVFTPRVGKLAVPISMQRKPGAMTPPRPPRPPRLPPPPPVRPELSPLLEPLRGYGSESDASDTA